MTLEELRDLIKMEVENGRILVDNYYRYEGGGFMEIRNVVINEDRQAVVIEVDE